MSNQIINEEDSNDKNSLIVASNKDISDVPGKRRIQLGGLVTVVLAIVFIFACVVVLTTFSIINYTDQKIKKGILIEGIDVSGLSIEEAKNKIQSEFLDKLDDTLYFQYGENVYSMALEQIGAKYNIDEAIIEAYDIGRKGSLIQRDLLVLKLPKNPKNITMNVLIDEVALDKCIEDISAKLPEQVVQPSYYIEDGKLIITSGKIGKAAANEETKQIIIDALNSKKYNDIYYDIPTYDKYPNEIDVEKIYNEIYRDAKDAYFTVEPRMVYPDEVGIDFEDSLENVKKQIESEKKEEYEIALKFTKAEITLNDIGQDAFPDMLSTFATKYVNNANRTTNLRLASNKISGTVLMPGEVFSYNTIVGERTIAAGYKNAAIYENGQVVDGLGGGICQVSTTLYNAALYSNLEIVERTNHMFLTTYADGGRDATVAYGSLDFKFKNNRSYPIKIISSVENGICTVQIYGLKTEDDYQVEIFTNKIGARTYQTYKRLYKDGQVVSTELLHTDSYHAHS